MEFTVADIDHLANLARLKFTAEEKQKLPQQLSELRRYVDKLNGLDLTDVPPTYHALDLSNVFREDEVKMGLTREAALMNAPVSYHGFFSVPRVIRDGSKLKNFDRSSNS